MSAHQKRRTRMTAQGPIEYEPRENHRGLWAPLRSWRWRTIVPLGPWNVAYHDRSALGPHLPKATTP